MLSTLTEFPLATEMAIVTGSFVHEPILPEVTPPSVVSCTTMRHPVAATSFPSQAPCTRTRVQIVDDVMITVQLDSTKELAHKHPF